jgi:hypothetical protein
MDPTLDICNTPKSKVLLLFHHVVSVYIIFGCFLFNPLYHLVFVCIVLAHWKLNNNRCEITLITNRECGIDEKTQFQDFLQTLNISKQYPNIHWLLLPILGLVDIYRISKNK